MPLPPDGRVWWQRWWGLALMTLLGAGVGAGIAVAATSGGGSEEHAAKTATITKTVTVTTVGPAPRVNGAPVRVITHTVTETVTIASIEPAHSITAQNSYSGNGRKKIGLLVLPKTSVLHWHAKAGRFTLENGPESVDHLTLSETGTSGEATIANGRFPALEVTSPGEWSFTIAPQ